MLIILCHCIYYQINYLLFFSVMEFVKTNKGGKKLLHEEYSYCFHKKSSVAIRWRCTQQHCVVKVRKNYFCEVMPIFKLMEYIFIKRHGELVKEAMVEAADSLFEEFRNKKEIVSAINTLQLSARTVTRRIEVIAENLEAELANYMENCIFFSLQMDESTDVTNISQLAICVKMCKGSLNTSFDRTEILNTSQHSHSPDEHLNERINALLNMKRKAEETHDKPSQIFAETVAAMSMDAMMTPLKRTLRNHKAKGIPKEPLDLKDLKLEDCFPEPKYIYFFVSGEWKENLLFDNGSLQDRILLFGTSDTLYLLQETSKWFLDGNFGLAPRHFTQLYVVRVGVEDAYITAIYALLQSKKKSTYEELFRTLIEKYGNFQNR
nr:uncharacterized protein LOC122271739 [Parasteatoda tepidariorum]